MNILLTDAITASVAQDWHNGVGSFLAQGSGWNGATVALQFSLDGGSTWDEVGTDTTLTQDGGGAFALAACRVRAAVTSGALTSAGVRVSIGRISSAN